MSKLKLLANQTAIYGISTIGVRTLNWFIAPFHSYIFDKSPENIGIMTELYAYIAFINVLLMYGLETAFFRYASTQKEKAGQIFSTAMLSLSITSFLFAVGIFVSAQHIANFLSYPSEARIIQLVAFILAFDALSNIPFAKLRLENKALQYVGIKFLNVLVTIALNAILLYPMYKSSKAGLAFDGSLALFYVFFANFMASFLTFLFFIPQFFKEKWSFDLVLWKQMMRYGLPLIIVGLAGIVNETIDRILLKYLLPGSLEERNLQVGIYGMAYKLSIFMSLVVQAYRMGAEPFFFKQAGDEDAKPTLAKAMTFFVIISVAVVLGVSFNLDWLILVLGPKFRAGKDIVPILLSAYLFLGIFYNLSVWYKLADKTHYASVVSVVGAATTILINVIFIPKYGYWASTWATLTSYLVMTIISWVWGQKHYPVPYEMGKILAYMLAGIVIFFFSSKIALPILWMNILFKNAIVLIFLVSAYQIDIKALLKKTEHNI